MELKPSKGVKVKVNAQREAIFGDESLSVQKVSINNGSREGVLTGTTLAGFCEVEMPKLDGRKHWYPIEDLAGEKGEKIVEEEVPIEVPDEDAEDSDEESA
jgi:hypothetical protein